MIKYGIMKSAVFFDIDGTIWDFRGYMPDSVRDAMEKLRQNGHMTFLCTGRSRGNIYEERLLALPLTGIVAACGNHIEKDGEMLYENLLTWDHLREIMDVLRKAKMPFIVEGPVDHWMNTEDFPNDWYVGNLWKSLGDHALRLDEIAEGGRFSKLSASIPEDADLAYAEEALSSTMDFINHGNQVVEIIPKGSGKDEGIRRTCELLDIPREATYAVGDSSNDLGMLRYAAHGICMGNGTAEAKQAAEYVTADLKDDGLYKAMEHYGLI